MAGFGQRWQQQLQLPLGATVRALPPVDDRQPAACGADFYPIAVVGAHLSGMPLNHELTSRGAYLLERTRSASHYQLYALAGSVPPKPALVAATEAETATAAIELELWALPKSQWADFLAGIPTPLGLGTVLLADGRRVKGFICEPGALSGARNITEFGGWRAFIRSLNATAH